MDKAEARKRLKEIRSFVQNREEKEAAMLFYLLQMDAVKKADCLFLYNAFGSEPATCKILLALQERRKRVCLPRVEGKEMLAVPIGPNTRWTIGAFGIREPIGKALSPQEVDAVICPGLGFDLRGGRIGYGGGFYDRFLKKTAATRIGLCYNACIWDCVPADELDERMHFLVSEAGVTGCQEDKK